MKKLLTILALSLLIFEGIFAYDALLNDGQAFAGLWGKEDRSEQINIVKPTEKVQELPPSIEPQITPEYVEQGNIEPTIVPTMEAPREEVQEDSEEILYHTATDYEYYYAFLSDQEKKVYRVMVDAFANIESGNAIETLDDESMNRVAQAVRNDHPEFFYLGEMGYTHYTVGGQIQSTVLNIKYTDTAAAIRSRQGIIEKNAQSIIDGISPSASDYEKTKYVYETVINMTDYDTNATDNQNIASVLLNGKSVCAGYTKTVQYLLNQMGVETAFIEGVDLIRKEGHAWNLVKIDGQYYYLDATWGDTAYKDMKGINYGYLNITTEELLRNHSIKEGTVVPECKAVDANYYVMEGLYFTSYDEPYVKQLFEEAYDMGESSVSFKCASKELYEEMKRNLITDQKVFKLLRSSNKVSYSVDEDERTLCFWL